MGIVAGGGMLGCSHGIGDMASCGSGAGRSNGAAGGGENTGASYVTVGWTSVCANGEAPVAADSGAFPT